MTGMSDPPQLLRRLKLFVCTIVFCECCMPGQQRDAGAGADAAAGNEDGMMDAGASDGESRTFALSTGTCMGLALT